MTNAPLGERVGTDASYRSPCCWPVHNAQADCGSAGSGGSSGSWPVHNAQAYQTYHSDGQMTQALVEAMTAMQLPMAASTSGSPRMLKLSDHLSVLVKPPPGLEDIGAATSAFQVSPASLPVLPTLLPGKAARKNRDRHAKVAERTNVVALLRAKEGASMLSCQLASLNGSQLHSFCAELVTSLLPDLKALACDPNAMPVISQLLALPGIDDLRLKIVRRLRGSLLKLTKDKHGCWIVQEALQAAPAELYASLALELRGHVLACCRHRHGNFVLQRCVELLSHDAVGFIVEELKDHAVDTALHIYSGRVMQRLIEHCPHSGNMTVLLDALLQRESLNQLIMDPYGNNVVRAILSSGKPVHIKLIGRTLAANVLAYAQHRHASLVMEAFLDALKGKHQDELLQERTDLMTSLLAGSAETSPFAQIALDRFGNYIAQRIMEDCQGSTEQQRVLDLLTALRPKLRHASNGQHILQAAQRKFGPRLSAVCEPAFHPGVVYTDPPALHMHECIGTSVINL